MKQERVLNALPLVQALHHLPALLCGQGRRYLPEHSKQVPPHQTVLKATRPQSPRAKQGVWHSLTFMPWVPLLPGSPWGNK